METRARKLFAIRLARWLRCRHGMQACASRRKERTGSTGLCHHRPEDAGRRVPVLNQQTGRPSQPVAVSAIGLLDRDTVLVRVSYVFSVLGDGH